MVHDDRLTVLRAVTRAKSLATGEVIRRTLTKSGARVSVGVSNEEISLHWIPTPGDMSLLLRW
jgi:hypothetical protein